jgi:hypothetical protein
MLKQGRPRKNAGSGSKLYDANPDPDQTVNIDADPVQHLLLIKVVQICDLWSTDPPRFHLRLHASIIRVHGPP